MGGRAGTDGKAGKAGKPPKTDSVRKKDDSIKEKEAAEARAARLLSRSLPSNGDGLSEAAAAQSAKGQQKQAETEADDSPIKKKQTGVRKQNRLEDSDGESDEDAELQVAGASASSEAKGREKLRKSSGMKVQIFTVRYSNIIILKQPRRIHHSKSNPNLHDCRKQHRRSPSPRLRTRARNQRF